MVRRRGALTQTKMRVDAYELVFKFEGDLTPALERARSLPEEDPARDAVLREYRVRLHECVKTHVGQWEGDVARIWTSAFPSVVPPQGKPQPLKLKDDHNLGESTAFLYDPPTRTMLVQQNRNGVSPSGVVDYLGRLCGLGEIEMKLSVRRDALRRLMQSRTIRVLRIGIKGANAGLFSSSLTSLADFMGVARRFAAPEIEVVMRVREKRESLVPSAKDMLRALVQSPPPDVEITNLSVVGTDEEYRSIPINLLNERMSFEVDVSLDHHRTLPFETRRQELREAWHLFEDSGEARQP